MKSVLTIFTFLIIAFSANAQKLESFTVNLQPTAGSNSYLSIAQKKVFTTETAKDAKTNIDLALVITQNGERQVLEWYNLSGRDNKIPAELTGTAAGIASLTFDKEQFEKCNTSQDLQRMTGHITNSSFVHFASVTDDIDDRVKYHCILIQLENGKRALLWIEKNGATSFTVIVKKQ